MNARAYECETGGHGLLESRMHRKGACPVREGAFGKGVRIGQPRRGPTSYLFPPLFRLRSWALGFSPADPAPPRRLLGLTSHRGLWGSAEVDRPVSRTRAGPLSQAKAAGAQNSWRRPLAAWTASVVTNPAAEEAATASHGPAR